MSILHRCYFTHTHSTALESLNKRLAAARETRDYDTMEVVQKTLDTVQARFNHEVTTSVTVFRRGLAFCVRCVLKVVSML
jgi:hypothetical protein